MSRIEFFEAVDCDEQFSKRTEQSASPEFGFAMEENALSLKKERNPLTSAFLDVLVDMNGHATQGFEVAISLAGSSTKTAASLHFQFLSSDEVFIPYTGTLGSRALFHTQIRAWNSSQFSEVERAAKQLYGLEWIWRDPLPIVRTPGPADAHP